MRMLGVVLAIGACGDNQATTAQKPAEGLAASIREVGELARDFKWSIREHKLAGPRDPQRQRFETLVTSAFELVKAITNQKRPVVPGELQACRDGWLAASDVLKDTFDPLVAHLRTPPTSKASGEAADREYARHRGGVMERWFRLQPVTDARLCDLRAAGVACATALDDRALLEVFDNRTFLCVDR